MASDQTIQALQATANRLRVHSIRMTTEAGSGHPTSCMSAADAVACLFFGVMRLDPRRPDNPDNDRFLMSKGHAAPLLYAALAEAGAITLEQTLTLRRIDSDLEGHPTPRCPWVQVGTGSLGQGLSVGVGMALGLRLDGSDARVFVMMGDGEIAEGAVWEAAAMAAHHHLDSLTGIVDVNRLGQSQATMYGHDLATYAAKFGAFGWHVLEVDGHDCAQLMATYEQALAHKGQPTVILARTLKGKGYAPVEDQNGFHGKPFSPEDAEAAIREIDAPAEPVGLKVHEASSRPAPPVPTIPEWTPAYTVGESVATRVAYGSALEKLGSLCDAIVALDGDVKNSTYSQGFAKAYTKRFFECYIAEQSMLGAAMGLATTGKIPFVSTFGAFLARAVDQVRMAGISQVNLKVCGSHAGVSIGEDGPSQMALEDLGVFRALPGSTVLYPSDAVSAERLVAEAARRKGIVFIRTTRPKTPVLYPNDEMFPVPGLKVLRQSDDDALTVVGAGVTVHEALEAHDALGAKGIAIRVIDLYAIKPLPVGELVTHAQQTRGTIVTVEDHYPEAGLGDAVAGEVSAHGVRVHKLAVNALPRSGQADELLDAYGISARCIVDKVQALV